MEKRRLTIGAIDKILDMGWGGNMSKFGFKVSDVRADKDGYLFELLEDVDGFTNRNLVKLWRDGVYKLEKGEWCFKMDTSKSSEEHWVTSSQIRDMHEFGVNLIYVIQRSRV
jgi:hypothetical protein